MNAELTQQINFILEEMKDLYLQDTDPWIIGYSGGKDSTTVVQLVFTMLMNLPKNYRHKPVHIVSSDTLIENPIVLAVLKGTLEQIEMGARRIDIPLYTHMVHPEYSNSYWANVIGKGLPTPTSIRFRWCTERLKIKPSNQFILDQIKENGRVIVLLGVRKAESIAREMRIKKREIDGYLLSPHATLNGAYVYNPIVELTTEDVWGFLLNNNGATPWGTSNNELFELYADGDGGECPFTNTSDAPSCGNSRFGCWICTVVAKDKSLTGFIKSGETGLQPLLDFREWIISNRNNHDYRMHYRRDGNHYYKKVYIDSLPLLDDYVIDENHIFQSEDGSLYIDLKKKITDNDDVESNNSDKLFVDMISTIVSEDNKLKLNPDKIKTEGAKKYIDVLGYGPFNFKGRQAILRKLLETQKLINEEYEDVVLITQHELEEIDKIWDNETDLSQRVLVDLYYDVMHEKLPWDSYKKPLFDDDTRKAIYSLCEEQNIDTDLVSKLLIETNKYKHFTNKSILDKATNKILNQRYLHKELVEGITNDN